MVAQTASSDSVLIVFEGCEVREDAMRKALELAKRLDCTLSALVLFGGASQDLAPNAFCVEALREVAAAEGVNVRFELRHGDPASVLLKFLAVSPPFRALVWGGEAAVVTAHPYGGGRHWFGRVRGQIRCPVVASEARKPGNDRLG